MQIVLIIGLNLLYIIAQVYQFMITITKQRNSLIQIYVQKLQINSIEIIALSSTSMQKSPKILLIITIFLTFIQQFNSQCCLSFQNNKCVQCPDGMHLFRNNCIYDVANCKNYTDGFSCSECQDGYTLDNMTLCNKIVLTSPPISNNTNNVSTANNSNTVSAAANISNVSSQFTDYPLKLPLVYQLNNITLEGAVVADQYLRSKYASITNANLKQAYSRTYKNQSIDPNDQYAALVYESGNGDLYKGVMMTNVQTFIFKEVSFEKVIKKIDNSTVTPVANNTNNSNIKNNSPINISSNGTIDTGFLNIDNNSSTTTVKNDMQLTQISTKNNTSNTTTAINSTPTATNNQTTTITNSITANNFSSNNSSSISALSISYFQQSGLQSLNDLYFVVTKNQLNNQLNGYDNLLPLKVFVSDNHPDFAGKLNGSKPITQDPNNIYYQVLFNKSGLIYCIQCHINIQTYIPVIGKQTLASDAQISSISSNQNSAPSQQNATNTTPAINYTQTTVQSAGMYYIIFRNSISQKNSALANVMEKYVGTTNISSDMIGYKVVLDVNASSGEQSYQIIGKVNKKTYQASVDSITNIKTTIIQSNSTNSSNSTANTNTNDNAGGAIIIKQSNSSQVIKQANTTNTTNTTSNSTKLPQQNTNATNPSNSSSNPPTNNLQNIVFGNNNQSQTINSSTSNSSQQQINPDLIMPRPSIKQYDTLSISNSHDYISNSNNSTVNASKNSSQTQLQKANSLIQVNSIGYSFVENSTYGSDFNIKYIDKLLKQMNGSIAGLKLYQVYIQNLGIQLNYKFYYFLGNSYSSLYMGYVVYDYFTRRAFVLRFRSLI